MFRKKVVYSDSALIEGILAGGVQREKCIAHIYDSHIGFIRKICREKHVDPEAARDAYADSVVRLSEQIVLSKFRGESKLSTYLYRIFFNKCVDVLRKKSSNAIETTSEFPELPDLAANMLHRLGVADEMKRVNGLLKQIGEKCKNILMDWAYHGYSMEEIAQRAGLKNAESAIAQKYKCMKKLKEKIRIYREGLTT